jgi:hypothetical protein
MWDNNYPALCAERRHEFCSSSPATVMSKSQGHIVCLTMSKRFVTGRKIKKKLANQLTLTSKAPFFSTQAVVYDRKRYFQCLLYGANVCFMIDRERWDP